MRYDLVPLALALAAAIPACAALNRTVQIDAGKLAGVPGSAPGIAVFRGIPYAAPPVGDLRWRPPKAPAAWTGVRSASAFGPDCMQRKSGPFGPWSAEFISKAGMEGGASEDCLYLNVWTPAQSAAARLPVFVWIHGGGFNSGSGGVPIYDGEGLASKGLVVVTINYRVGVFGFLAHPELTAESDRRASGNYGLLDMLAALEWVHRNIAAFGGDPGRVTIAGQSAGAFAVNYLVASPLGKGLFHRAIAESGGAFLPARGLKEAEDAGLKFAQARQAATLAALRAIPADSLLAAGGQFGPIVDGYAVPMEVRRVFEAGAQNDVPAIVGWNRDEGLGSGAPSSAQAFRESASKTYGDMAGEFLKAFPADTDEQAAASDKAAARDRMFAWQSRVWARLQQKTGKSKVFVYEFARVAPGTPEQLRLGAFHSGEIGYALNTLAKWNRPWTAADRELAGVMSAYWANFAKTGDPNGAALPSWPPYGEGEAVMRIGDKLQVVRAPYKSELDFFDAFAQRGRR